MEKRYDSDPMQKQNLPYYEEEDFVDSNNVSPVKDYTPIKKVFHT